MFRNDQVLFLDMTLIDQGVAPDMTLFHQKRTGSSVSATEDEDFTEELIKVMWSHVEVPLATTIS